MFDQMLAKVRNNKVVASGLEVYNIAREVYKLVNTGEGNQSPAEDLYATAVESVTLLPTEAIRQRLDYRTVRKTAGKCRTVQSQIRSCRSVVKESFSKIRERAVKSMKRSVDQMRLIYSKFQEVFESSRFYQWRPVQSVISRLRRLGSRLACVKTRLTGNQLDNMGVDDLREKGMQTLKTLKTMIRNSINYFSDTVAHNDECIKDAANYSYQSAREGMRTNWELFLKTLKMHEQLLIKYFTELEFEVYYGPGKSIKVVDLVKEYIDDITLDVREQESIIFETDGNCGTINLLESAEDVMRKQTHEMQCLVQESLSDMVPLESADLQMEDGRQEEIGEPVQAGSNIGDKQEETHTQENSEPKTQDAEGQNYFLIY